MSRETARIWRESRSGAKLQGSSSFSDARSCRCSNLPRYLGINSNCDKTKSAEISFTRVAQALVGLALLYAFAWSNGRVSGYIPLEEAANCLGSLLLRTVRQAFRQYLRMKLADLGGQESDSFGGCFRVSASKTVGISAHYCVRSWSLQEPLSFCRDRDWHLFTRVCGRLLGSRVSQYIREMGFVRPARYELHCGSSPNEEMG